MSKVLTVCSWPCGASSTRPCATARHGSSAVDCAQINGCLSSSWRALHGRTAGASAWRRRLPACHATTARTPSPATPRRLWTGAKSKLSCGSSCACAVALHPIKAVAVSGSSARCNASKSASGEGTHSPSTATRISVEASLDFTSSSPGSELAATDEVASRELSLTWFISCQSSTLLAMQKRSIQRAGPPAQQPTKRNQPSRLGPPCAKKEPVKASPRKRWLICQESSVRTWEDRAWRACPHAPLILKIARALKCSSAHLMALTEAKLRRLRPSPRTEAGSRRGPLSTLFVVVLITGG